MSARLRFGSLFVLATAGCSLICTFDGLQQPCDSEGACLAGYQCVNGLCVGGTSGGGSGGGTTGGASGGASCTSNAACLAGACVSGACSDLPMAFGDGGTAHAASLDSCYPWPPFQSAGNAPVSLSGCVVGFPGDTLGAGSGATVQLFEDTINITVPTATVANAACASGVGYRVQAPPDQLLRVEVVAPSWAATDNPAVLLPLGDGGPAVRNVLALSANGWSAKLALVAKALNLPTNAEDALELGVVRDCSGNPLSGISVQATSPQDAGTGIAIGYLDATGASVAGRTATDSSGYFAAIALPGPYTLSFVANTGAGTETLATLPITVTARGSDWIDLAPNGP